MSAPLIVSIGYGAMAQAVASGLARNSAELRLSGALVRRQPAASLASDFSLWQSVEDVIAAKPDLVVECAGHGAVRDSVPALLSAGIDVVIVSIGVLGDAELREEIERAAKEGGARATVVSGAIGGLDVLRSGALAGMDEVVYIGRKPPVAWRGTPAEEALDLSSLQEAAVFFEGTADDASAQFPKNANVAAAVALAGVGFDKTRVKLIADPAVSTNSHELEARGAFGSFKITLNNNPLPENPKTSWLAALSVEQAVIRHFSTLEI